MGHVLQLILRKRAASLTEQARNYITALYLSGDKAKEQYAVLTPFMNFKETLGDPELERSIKWRKVGFERLRDVQEQFQIYSSIKEALTQLEDQRNKITEELRASKSEEESLKSKGKQLREEMKKLREKFYPIENHFICRYLELPNFLHERTPQEYPKLLYRSGLPKNSNKTDYPNHLDRKDLIDFGDKFSYYLLGDAASYNWELPQKCVDVLLKNKFTAATCPDFSRSVLVEAALIGKDDVHEVVEEDTSKPNALHLTGGGSLPGFLGYIAKLSIYPNVLPLKLVSVGQKYWNVENRSADFQGLYSVVQSNVVEAFIAAETSKEADLELDAILNLIVDIYKELGLLFQIEYKPANQLNPAESLRASIQVHSPRYDRFIEVGSLSHYGEFISKRLLFNVRGKKKNSFPHILSGTVANVTSIIACLIENQKPLKLVDKLPKSEKFEDLFSIR